MEGHPNSEAIASFLNLYNRTLLVPQRIVFDKEGRRYNCKKNGFAVKAFIYIWLLMIILYMSLVLLHDANVSGTIKVVVVSTKFTWLAYTLFDAASLKCLWTKGPQIAELLTEGNNLLCYCDRVNGVLTPEEAKKAKYQKYIVWLICALAIFYAIVFVMVVVLQLTAGTSNLYHIFLNATNDYDSTANFQFTECNFTDVLCNIMERSSGNLWVACVVTLCLCVAYSTELIWVIFLLMMASWGIFFRTMLTRIIRLIEVCSVDLSSGIRMYARATVTLEDFNNIFGTALLWIVISSVLYKAITLGEFLAGHTHNGFYDVVNIAGFIPFLVTLYIASEVHKIVIKGYLLPSTIKRLYLSRKIGNSEKLELIHGTSIAQFDALSNNIGFKGIFFTMSYSFVASLIGLTLTYSLVNVQLNLGEYPLH